MTRTERFSGAKQKAEIGAERQLSPTLCLLCFLLFQILLLEKISKLEAVGGTPTAATETVALP